MMSSMGEGSDDERNSIHRRGLLTALSVASIPLAAGCTDQVEDEPPDTDDSDSEPETQQDSSDEPGEQEPEVGLVDPEIELEIEADYIPIVTRHNSTDTTDLAVTVISEAPLEEVTATITLDGEFGSTELDDLEDSVEIDGQTAELTAEVLIQRFQPGENTLEVDLHDGQGNTETVAETVENPWKGFKVGTSRPA